MFATLSVYCSTSSSVQHVLGKKKKIRNDRKICDMVPRKKGPCVPRAAPGVRPYRDLVPFLALISALTFCQLLKLRLFKGAE